MQLIDGIPVYAATDLVGFLACEHLTALERAALHGLVPRPQRIDPELEVIQRRGREHEARYLAERQREGRTVVTVEPDGYLADAGERLRAAASATERAMAGGAEVIYQATLFDGRWRGHADFLQRVDSPARPSRWGPYHYEVVDTKLARQIKAGAVLQLCSYVELVTALQGVQPEFMYVALGGSARAVERLRVDDYMAYYRAVKARFEAAVAADAAPPVYPPTHTYPDPVDHCDVCRWALECEHRRRADDHTSLVAGTTARQRKALAGRGVTTLGALGELPLPADPPLDGVSPAAVMRIREQARVQLEGRRAGRLLYELLLPPDGGKVDPERGLATLPAPSSGDLFLDIEGDPYALDDGLDYLFGVLDGDGTYHAFWATDERGEFTPAGERRAFERLMDFVTARLARDPVMHVYHYAAYEPAALKRLMGRHATREDEVDRLLRGGVLVDLHRAVRQGLRASVESYSIKRLEPLYGFAREVDLRDAGSSIVAFTEWLQLGDGERPGADHLRRIEAYNRDDVASNRCLRDWLEARRIELAVATGRPVPRPAERSVDPPPDLSEAQRRVAALAARLADDVPADPTNRTEEQQGRWLLAQLLSWHRREEKATWWEFFRLMGLNADQLVEESHPIGGLEPVGPVGAPAGRGGTHQVWRYRYPDQDHDIRAGMRVYDPALTSVRPDGAPRDWLVGEVAAADVAARTVDVKRRVDAPHPTALVALDLVPTPQQQAALLRLGQWVAEHGPESPDGRYRAGRDLLLRRAPRVGQAAGEPLRRPGESALDAARRLILTMDRGTLAIQGPPGSGKTYTGARMIAALLRAGRAVGICATSHKVIAHLLGGAIEAALEEGAAVRPMQRADDVADRCDHALVQQAPDHLTVHRALAAGRVNLVGGTAWLWSRQELAEAADVMFVDEAGQMSLANVLAISQAARALVLLGDPQQLEQPLQGTHPPGAERSALAHLLDGASTMPPERGLFLETTWRLHPEVCRFTSEAFYDGRLQPEAHLARQELRAPGALAGTGLRWVEVAHAGNDIESAEEAAWIARVARSLVGGGASWVNERGAAVPVTWHDLLIVAPYNAQVGAIRRLLPPEARVGTVDKFQGQEAPLALYSMTSSSAADAPRGMDFLYSRHRLNVATSRARCVAVVLASPELIRVRARTPKQMRLANALCRFVELAAPVRTPSGGRPGSAA
ncbi:MAG: TM0106 family RecB-like putative nuclease [Armatimonadota bacterium]|nr:TM0106 family RecB-like putative nuclease [Armatimonadota bacterium]